MSDKFSCFPKINEKNLLMLMKNAEEDEIERVLEDIWSEMVEETVLGLCFDVHRSVKLGTFFLQDTDNAQDYELVRETGLDVFGQAPLKKQFECICPNCDRNLAASRFAPHLEKCLGMGRNSSRLASKRIANSGGGANKESEDDDDNDNDWNYQPEKKASKKRKERRNSPRPTKSKLKNGDSGSVSSNSSNDSANLYTNYDTMSKTEKKGLLIQMCGVVSEHTRKMCTKSQRCPQHTDQQRKDVRSFLLKDQIQAETVSEEVQIDIDTYDDSENQTIRESMNGLWESNSNEGSTAGDSITSSNDSWSLSLKKDRKDKLKKATLNSQAKNKKSKKCHPSSSQPNASNSNNSPSTAHHHV